jgi:YVTN family beta-propeller protein
MNRFSLLVCLVALIVAPGLPDAAERVYVGEKVCRQCHQVTHEPWYLSAHARAYATLSMHESVEIIRLSGLDQDPYESPICLGCHTTAWDTEAWERDETFHFEDGVQCERCHGPGSEYIEPEIMADPQAAMAAGLRMPDQMQCMVCHKAKGSHRQVLTVREYEVDVALAEIAHSGAAESPAESSMSQEVVEDGPGYTGAFACAGCHGDAVFSLWRLSAHAEASAALAGERAQELAREQGVAGEPARASACLVCHTTAAGVNGNQLLPGFDHAYGVQCEACHGPGESHAAGTQPMQPVTDEVCNQCHTGDGHAAGPRSLSEVPDHRLAGQARPPAPEYKTPFNLTVSGNGARLYVVCEASDSLVVVDTVSRKVIAEVEVESLPHGVCLSPGESRIYVSNRGSDTVSVIDARKLEVIGTIAVGDEPHGLVTDVTGKMLYVANAGSYDISVVDLLQRQEIRRLSAGRGTWDVCRSPDGGSVYLTNNLSHLVPFREPCLSEVTVIGTDTSTVSDRIMIPEANLVQGVDVAPSGDYTLVTLIRTKNLVPMTRVIQGWVMTNGIGILWQDGRVDQLLLDEPDSYFADPTDLVITPDGRYAYVSGGGIDAVAVIDLERIQEILANASDEEREQLLPNHLGVTTEYVLKRIKVGQNPRGLAVSSDGRLVYVADALDDTVSVIDVRQQQRIAVIDLGGPKEISLARAGERIFHSAEVTYGHQFSCHSCHPDGGIDGITYDIEPDGIGLNPVDNRTLRGILDTAPFKWTGKNPSLSRQCGPRLAVFFTRIDPFTPEQVTALERYICTIPRNPNRYRGVGEELTPAQRRGKQVFERTHTNSGDEIPLENRCDFCHSGPYFTNRGKFFVGEGSSLDTHNVFDVPHLNNIYETSPYLHDGRAETLEEIWTRYNPKDEHGVTNDMTKDQLNDLVEYLKTL